MKHLRFYTIAALSEHNEGKHPLGTMAELGITYQHATPQSIADQWWFWCCENVPDELPKYLTVLDIDPMDCIGFGLSFQEAMKIKNYMEQNENQK